MSNDADDRPLDSTDLDVTDDESIRPLGDDRFVVATGSGPPRDPSDDDADVPPSPDTDPDGAADRRRAEALLTSGDDYGFDAVFAADGRAARGRATSDDVAETFGALLSWFARSAGGDSPPAETLGLLLAATDTPVTLPERAVREALVRHDLSPDDSVGDLLAAVRDDGGLRLG